MSTNKNTNWVLPTAIGVIGGIIGAIGAVLIERHRQKKQVRALRTDVYRINRELASERQKLEELTSLQLQKRKKQKRSQSSSSASDISDEEFYDLTDEDNTQNSGRKLNLRDLQRLDDNLDKQNVTSVSECMRMLNNLCTEFPDEPELLHRLGKCWYYLAMQAGIPDDQKQGNIATGIQLCLKSLESDQNNAKAHKWFAILIGVRSRFQSINEQISDGYLFKKHLDIAMSIDPQDPVVHHLIGMFKFEIAGINWLQRTAASALFGEPPRATYEEALECFLNAERLSKKHLKKNKMYVGKCYKELGNYDEAVDWLRKAMEADDDIDEMIEELDLNVQIRKLLKECGFSN